MARQFWWPKSQAEQYQKVKIIKDGLTSNQVALGLTNQQVVDMQSRCDAFTGSYDFCASCDQTMQSVTEWRDQVWYGTPKGDDVSPAPIFAVMGGVTYTRGSVTQIFEDREYVLSLGTCTDAIAENIGYLGAEEDAPDLGSFQPTLKAEAAQQGNFAFGMTIANRGKSDQWVVSAALVGTTDWQEIGTFTGKTADATWPGGGTQPVTIQLRVQLRKGNDNYGQPSAIILVTLIP